MIIISLFFHRAKAKFSIFKANQERTARLRKPHEGFIQSNSKEFWKQFVMMQRIAENYNKRNLNTFSSLCNFLHVKMKWNKLFIVKERSGEKPVKGWNIRAFINFLATICTIFFSHPFLIVRSSFFCNIIIWIVRRIHIIMEKGYAGRRSKTKEMEIFRNNFSDE